MSLTTAYTRSTHVTKDRPGTQIRVDRRTHNHGGVRTLASQSLLQHTTPFAGKISSQDSELYSQTYPFEIVGV